ncbi:hypothetical protein QBC35DRAFT_99377 [Podospora australis]|uniref:Nephrocystin 3-like N-terminal domain-containing protein n=1 Tax=Podospora australis TaxID=1536484 RepID=A0AAN6X5D3_9PEZI|nr:hypothetical protein QBC35DRAFT_99377 [Podospora australis]
MYGRITTLESQDQTTTAMAEAIGLAASIITRFQASLTRLAWPSKATTAKKLLDEITREKATITMAMGGEVMKEVKEVKQMLGRVQVTLDKENEKRALYNWLRHTDPSAIHNASIGLYEPGTGEWVMRCKEWKDWLALRSASSCIWIRGIPGVGKTVLASYLNKVLKTHCENLSDDKITSLYYYCLYSHEQDETIPILRWLVIELCRHFDVIPPELYELFGRGYEPQAKDLLRCLSTILKSERIAVCFFVVDALDESQSRQHMLHTIRVLTTKSQFKKLRLLVTSREYIDIQNVMLPISHVISMSDNENVQADIDLYISAKITSTPKFNRWPADVRTEVEQALSAGAKGMFRWVVCQLDILRRLHNINRIREALHSLPQTLDETYERIFSLIPAEERTLVRNALHWLVFNHKIWDRTSGGKFGLSVQEVTEASSMIDAIQADGYGPFDPDTLKESCGCLVRFEPLGGGIERATVAHYTVREFLGSQRTSTASSALFKFTLPSLTISLCETILKAILLFGQSEPSGKLDSTVASKSQCNGYKPPPRLLEHCAFSIFIAIRWDLEASILTLEPFLLELFNPALPHYPAFIHFLRDRTVFEDGTEDVCWDTNYLDLSSRTGLSDGLAFRWSFGLPFWLLYWPPPAFYAIERPMTSAALILHLLTLGNCFLLVKHLRSQDKCVLHSRVTTELPYHGSICPWLYRGEAHNDVLFNISAMSVRRRSFNGTIPEIAGLIGDRQTILLILALLQLGASADPTGYYITPLQIAVSLRDRRTVGQLLKAGANPNATGDSKATSMGKWGKGSLLEHFNCLHGKTPLTINRKRSLCTQFRDSTRNRKVRRQIRKLLSSYGAIDPVADDTEDEDSVDEDSKDEDSAGEASGWRDHKCETQFERKIGITTRSQ